MKGKAWLAPFVLALAVAAQDESERPIWDEEFLSKRPADSAASRKPVIYRIRTDQAAQGSEPDPSRPATMLGITLWRLRPPGGAEKPGARLLVHESSGGDLVNQELERIGPETEFSDGDRVRISVEGSVNGYLYVIDREQYADGAMSAPYLIYPNGLTQAGDNFLAPGRLIDIPDQRDRPNVLTVQSKQGLQTAEALSFLVTPQPIENLDTGDGPVKLDVALYREWESKWGAKAEVFELQTTNAPVWTPQEKRASADHHNRLTQSDPPPQTLYRIAVAPRSPFLLQVLLRLKN